MGSDRAGTDDRRTELGNRDGDLEDRTLPDSVLENVPDWDDAYLDRVSDRLMHTYDLEKDVRARDESVDLSGELRVESSKHLFHPSIQYANHHMREYLHADRRSSVSVSDLERMIELGHELADERVEPGDEHRATEFTFVLVVPEIPDDVREFVEGFSDRTLLTYGFHGHYEIHCCVVAPEREEIVASDRTEIDAAFALWESVERKSGVIARVRGLFSR